MIRSEAPLGSLWISCLQFALAIAVVLLARRALTVEPAARPLPPGWLVLRPPFNVQSLAIEGDRVWVGSTTGLTLLDRRTGQIQETTAAIPDLSYVKDIMLDRTGNLWVAHAGGVARRVAGCFRDTSDPCGSLAGARALLEERRGGILVATDARLARYEAQTWSRVLGPDGGELPALDCLAQDNTGGLWVGCGDAIHGYLACFQQGHWRRFGTADGLAHPAVNAILPDPTGELWFGTGFSDRGGTTRRGKGRWQTLPQSTTRLTPSGPLSPGGKVRSLSTDRSGRLWMGFEYGGCAAYDGKRFTVLTPENGLSGWEVRKVAEDTDGQLWIATENGVSRIPRRSTE
jgi:ligand-binding sensor domain-containing protein